MNDDAGFFSQLSQFVLPSINKLTTFSIFFLFLTPVLLIGNSVTFFPLAGGFTSIVYIIGNIVEGSRLLTNLHSGIFLYSLVSSYILSSMVYFKYPHFSLMNWIRRGKWE